MFPNLSKTEELRHSLKLYFIMGSQNCEKDPSDVLREAIAGGITMFQFREKGPDAKQGEERVEFARELQKICKEHNIPFIVNDDVQLAVQIDADGVHIGQDDENAHIAREKLKGKILGVSAHNLEEVKEAIKNGADYVGMGPVYPTKTKKDALAVQGTDIIKEVRNSRIDIPIVGIGGITAHTAGNVIESGADGVSIISAISQADSPLDEAKQLRKAIFG